MQVSDYDYQLPPELIAKYPAPRRELSRMVLLDRVSGRRRLGHFTDFPGCLRAGDCLVLNDTQVIPARLHGRRVPSGGQVEAFLLEEGADGSWQAMLRPGRRLQPGDRVHFHGADEGFTVTSRFADGTFGIRFDRARVADVLEQFGAIPLPPYLGREAEPDDAERYQTVYARCPGAVAAPTAGLHFTPEMLAALQAAGIDVVRLTLHVGAGTFKPVSSERIEDHLMHAESFELAPEAAASINAAHARGSLVCCVGTTTVRVLETCAIPGSRAVRPARGRTDIFMYPPYQPRIPDLLLTNFHLPQSTLLMLVSTFCPREKVLEAYAEAIAARLRFFSYGDCMLLLPPERFPAETGS